MKSANELLRKDAQTILATSQITQKPRIFNPDEKDRVGYFFLRLGNIYGAGQMERQWPDDESMKLVKREYAAEIVRFSREQIHNGFERLKTAREQGEYEFINVDAAIGFIKNEHEITGSWGTGAHKIFKPEKLIGQGTEEGRQKAGEKALGDMKGMFE